MQKNILLIMLCFMTWSISFLSAQSLRYQYVNAEYVQLPSHPFDTNFRTYNVNIKHQEPLLNDIGFDVEKTAAEHFNFEGFDNVPEDGDFSILVDIGEFKLKKVETQSQTKTLKDSAELKNTFYNLKVIYDFPITLIVINNATQRRLNQLKSFSSKSFTFGKKDELKDYIIPKNIEETQRETLQMNNFTDSVKLNNAWEIFGHQAINKQLSPRIHLFLKQSTDALKTRHDYQKKTDRVLIYNVSKKSADFEEFEKIFDLVACTFSKMSAERSVHSLQDQLQSAIDFWLKIKDNYSTEDKKTKAIYQACLDNVATVYYWLEDFENAKKYNEQAAALAKKGLHSKRLKLNKSIASVQKILKTNNCTSRHFPLNNGYIFPKSQESLTKTGESNPCDK